MQIVIDIPEYLYKAIQSYKNPTKEETAIANGTPLPKGHGRLIDADRFINDFACCGYIEDMDVDYFRTVVPTIIEADTESEDKCKNCEYYHNPDYTRCHECEAERGDKK